VRPTFSGPADQPPATEATGDSEATGGDRVCPYCGRGWGGDGEHIAAPWHPPRVPSSPTDRRWKALLAAVAIAVCAVVAVDPAVLLTAGPMGIVLSHGPFTGTGSMTAARADQEAVLLKDGRVLVVGGESGVDYYGDPAPLNSAELYDPGAGVFTATGSMSAYRLAFTATLLDDGRVLVAGGTNGTDALDSAELWDPKTGSFSATGVMARRRWGHSATLLRDGEVLIVGGQNDNSDGLASAELYDPTTGTFKPTGSLALGRSGQTATLLQNGRVLIAGGSDNDAWDATSSAEIYDPSLGLFSSTGSMAMARASDVATLLNDGRVLITGGNSGEINGADLAAAEIYNPSSGTFLPTGPMGTARSDHTATLLGGGEVLVAGGEDDRGAVAAAEVFDPSTGTFKEFWSINPFGLMNSARAGHTATLLPNGRVLLAGGWGGGFWSPETASAELFKPQS
jgi:Galactose oxidase, central domain/Kelch motif